MSVPFRDVPKDGIEIRLPRDFATVVRERAGRERRSVSEVSSELMLRGAGIDPADYGIKAGPVPVTA